MSRWEHWSRGTEEKGKSFSSFLLEQPVNTGNPSATMGPAERARSLGLQSNGKGGYIDPNSGQVVARTVNNELIFYDSNRATGGAISDGSGGAALTQAQPSWADPLTGMLTTPPSKAETPSEIAAIPDPTPATAPFGYNAFMKQKKMDAYQQNQVEPQMARGTPDEIEQENQAAEQQAAQGDAGEQPAFSAEDYTPGDLLKKMGEAPPSSMAANVAKARAQAQPTAPQVQQKDTQTPAQPSVVPAPETRAQEREMEKPRPDDRQIKKQAQGILGGLNQERLAGKIDMEAEEGRRKKLDQALEQILQEPDKQKGAGKNNLSRDDVIAFQNYIKNGPQNERTPVTPDEMEYALQYLKNSSGDKWKGMESRLKGKGDPPAVRKIKERASEVLGSYLENLGTSAVDGQPLPFSESELDHGVSLDNGGEDNGENWRWLPTRFNQFKGALEDADLLQKLNAELERDPTDENLKIRQQELMNKIRGDLSHQFKDGGIGGLNVADIMSQKGVEGMQFLKALAEANGVSHYKDRGKTRDSGRAGGGTSLAIGELQQRLIDELGIPDQADIDMFDENMFNVLDDIEEQRYQLSRDKKVRSKELRDAKRKAKINKNKPVKEGVYYSYSDIVMSFMEALEPKPRKTFESFLSE